MLVQEQGIVLRVESAPDLVCDGDQHLLMAAQHGRDLGERPGCLPVQAATGVVAAFPNRALRTWLSLREGSSIKPLPCGFVYPCRNITDAEVAVWPGFRELYAGRAGRQGSRRVRSKPCPSEGMNHDAETARKADEQLGQGDPSMRLPAPRPVPLDFSGNAEVCPAREDWTNGPFCPMFRA